LMIDGNEDSVVTSENFLDYWQPGTQVGTQYNRVYMYSPGSGGGAQPTYPYTPSTESEWNNVYEPHKGHKWMRFRTDDIDANEDDVFDNWTIPIPIGNAFV